MPETNIQRLLDMPDPVTGEVNIPAGEYEGRFTVRKSCTVNGGGAVICGASGPVLIIEAENVSLNNISIMLTNDSIPDEQRISVYCRHPDTKFSGVRMNGMLLGIPGEEQYFGMPDILDLGRLAAEREQSFSFELYLPCPADISCGFKDIRLSADSLPQGFNTVTLTVGKVRSGSLLYGHIYVKTSVTRSILVCGEIGGEDEPAPQNYMLYTADRSAPLTRGEMLEHFDLSAITAMTEPKQETVSIRMEEINESTAPEDNASEADASEENVFIRNSKTIPLSMKQYKIELLYSSARTELDIDGFMFMLGTGGSVISDRHMVFFGNERSPCGGVHYLNAPDKRAMFVDFRLIPKDVTRMVMLFSIYGKDPDKLFDKLADAEISVLCENGVHMHMPLESGLKYRTILALGFKKTDGIWEMITSGKGIDAPLEDICRRYGVTII